MLLLPLPRVLQELLSGKRMLIDALLLELGHHFRLCSYGGVVCTGYPAGVETPHASTANQHVLNGIVEHVPHVEDARYIGRWDYYSIGDTAIWFTVEEVMLQPVIIPIGLYRLRFILRGKVAHDAE